MTSDFVQVDPIGYNRNGGGLHPPQFTAPRPNLAEPGKTLEESIPEKSFFAENKVLLIVFVVILIILVCIAVYLFMNRKPRSKSVEAAKARAPPPQQLPAEQPAEESPPAQPSKEELQKALSETLAAKPVPKDVQTQIEIDDKMDSAKIIEDVVPEAFDYQCIVDTHKSIVESVK